MWLRISAGARTGWFERAVCPGSWKVRSRGGSAYGPVPGRRKCRGGCEWGRPRSGGPSPQFESVISGRGLDECKNWRRAQYLMGASPSGRPTHRIFSGAKSESFRTRFSRPCVLRIQHVPRTLVARRRPSRFLVGLTPLLQGMQVVGSLPGSAKAIRRTEDSITAVASVVA